MTVGFNKTYLLGTVVGEVAKLQYEPYWKASMTVQVETLDEEKPVSRAFTIQMKGATARNAANYLGDGKQVFVEAELCPKDGIVATRVRYL